MKLSFIKTWEAGGNGVFEPDMIVATAYKTVFSSYRPKHFLYYYKDNDKTLGEAYDEEGEMKKFDQSGFKDFKNKKYLATYFRKIQEAIKHNQQICQKVDQELTGDIESKKLYQLLKESIQSMAINYSCFLACQPQRFISIENEIREQLAEFVSGEKLEDVYRTLSTPTENSPIIEEQIDWLELAIKIKEGKLKNKKLLDELLKKHHQKYAVLHAGDGQSSASLDHYLDKIKKEKRSLAILKLELKKITRRDKEIFVEQQKLIKKYKISKELVSRCFLLGKIGHRRLLMRIQGWLPLYESMKKIIRVLAIRTGYDYDLIRFSAVNELLGIAQGKLVSKKLLLGRKKCFLLIYEKGKVRVVDGRKAQKAFNKFVPREEFEKMKEVRGMVAMKGVIRGRALLFQWGDNMIAKINTIKKGETVVLVAGQTRPSLMPLIVKCHAIVTDEGGIISHSAIVSRELGIPCIVGTRIGTRVLKDGDLVEVDADKGIVRILKHH